MDQKTITTAKAVLRINQVLIGIWVAVSIVFLLGIDSQSSLLIKAMIILYFSSFILLIISFVFGVSGLLRAQKLEQLNDPANVFLCKKLKRTSNILFCFSIGFFVFVILLKFI